MRFPQFMKYVSLLIPLILLGIGASTPFSTALFAASNPIVTENLKPGSTGWQINYTTGHMANDTNGQIRGYASAVSINKGQSINFHVTVNPAQTFKIDVYRMGWYNGAGGRLMKQSGTLKGTKQPDCPMDAQTGMIECNWAVAYTLAVPTSWTTGIYLAKLTNAANFQSYIVFAVRDDSRIADFLYQQPVTTYQAYNNYPADGARGKSLYDFNSFGPNTALGTKRAVKVSFNRPYGSNGEGEDGGQFADSIYWERYFVSWAERMGYDISYATDLDVHLNGASLLKYKGFLSVGHDEYWSKPMRDAVETARDAGVHLAFFAANTAYWQIRFEPSKSGVPNRVVVGYKDASLDPVTDPTLKTILWRDLNRAEQTLVGVQFSASADSTEATAPYIIQNSGHWVWSNTGFVDGSSVPGLTGYEVDRLFTNYPAPASLSYTKLASSPYVHDRAESSIYQAPSGAWVFGAGTISWSWGLDRPGYTNAGIQQATKNILDHFLQPFTRPATQTPAATPTITPTPTNTPVMNSSLGNQAWQDLNQNGVQDGNEPYLAGVSVNLLSGCTGTTVVSTQVTDANGWFTFAGLAAGQYRLHYGTPTDYHPTLKQQGTSVSDSDVNPDGSTDCITVAVSQNDATWDAGFVSNTAPTPTSTPVMNSSLGNQTWQDLNQNGIQDGNEPYLAGVSVNLLSGCTGTTIVDTQVTDANGWFTFANLAAGQYRLHYATPTDYHPTLKQQGPNASDSDMNPDGSTDCITVAASQNDPTWDAGFVSNTAPTPTSTPVMNSSLGNQTWQDLNQNGIQDDNEPYLAGVSVSLLSGCTGTTVVDTQVTDANGWFTFASLAAGQYRLHYATPTDYHPTLKQQGPNASDSDVNPDGSTDCITVAASQNDATWDAGFVANTTPTPTSTPTSTPASTPTPAPTSTPSSTPSTPASSLSEAKSVIPDSPVTISSEAELVQRVFLPLITTTP